MKRLNWKLFFLLKNIELIVNILVLVGVIIFLLFLLDSAFPIFKYSVLCLKIGACICLVLSLIILLVMIRKAQKKQFHSFSNRNKIVYSLSYLFLSLSFLFSIEYLIYIDNKKYFDIENKYITNSIINKVNNIHENIDYCEGFVNKYSKIYKHINKKSYIHYTINNDGLFYAIIASDTIRFRLHKRGNLYRGSVSHNRFLKRDGLFDGVREVGISLKNEFYNLSHPSNKAILESMKSSDSINSVHLQQLIKEKIQFYNNKLIDYNEVLKNELTISFGDFIIYNIFDSSIVGNKTHILIRLIFLLQAIVITFFSGYIYQTFYNMLDGKGNQKPEA